MIQRIQSLYLLLAAFAMGGLFFLPFGKGNAVENTALSDTLFNVHDSKVTLFTMAASALILLIAIFLFKNRKIQRLVVTAGLFCTGILLGFIAMNYFNEQELFSKANNFQFSFGMAMPFLTIIFSALASSRISKDDNLVKSMDRLR